MAADDHSRVAFGRRGLDTRVAAAVEPSAGLSRSFGRVLYLLGLLALLALAAILCFSAVTDIGRLSTESGLAEDKVREIVNQPVTHLPRSGSFDTFSPGWFHPGANEPDYGNVDIRTTQDFPYSASDYVSSDLNPTEMFVGSELEFNAMTKYFYTDRDLPKKRLRDDEMVEINGLYRMIGEDRQAVYKRWLMVAAIAVAALCLLAVLFPLLKRANSADV